MKNPEHYTFDSLIFIFQVEVHVSKKNFGGNFKNKEIENWTIYLVFTDLPSLSSIY